MSNLSEAIAWATQLHESQTDKGGAPYILHVLRVMLACETEEQRIAAMLHDTVEDCGVAPGEITFRFGVHIRDAVVALTRRDEESYEAFVKRCGKNPIARRVKLADLADNMNTDRLPRPLTPADHRRQEKYHKASQYLETNS